MDRSVPQVPNRLTFLTSLRLLLTPRDLLPALTPGVLSLAFLSPPQAGAGLPSPSLLPPAPYSPAYKLGGEFAEDAPEAPPPALAVARGRLG